MQTIQDKLMAWGQSKSLSLPPNGFPSVAPFARSIQNPGDQADAASVTPLSDDEHERVDRAVSDLKNTNRVRHKVICFAYIGGMLDNEIARALRMSWEEVRGIRLGAENWVDNKLAEEAEIRC